jgi:Tfp pilus assembly protein PilW
MALPGGIRGARGSTLVELVVAMLLVAVAVSSLMAAMLSLPRNQQASQEWERGSFCANSVLHDLRNYVKPAGFTDAIPTAPTDMTNPASPKPWHLPGDTCTSCWALEAGLHDGTMAMPASCRTGTYAATLAYTVAVVVINGQETRTASAVISWHSKTR